MALDKKQHVQMAILGGIVGAGVIYAIVVFGLMPLLASMESASNSLIELDEKINKAKAMARTRDRVQTEYDQTKLRIRSANASIPLPKLGNYLMDMQKTLAVQAEDLDMEVISIVDHDQIPVGPGNSPFRLYRVRVNVKCSYMIMREYIRRIEAHNPYLSVPLVSVTPQANVAEKHDITLVVSWVVWKNPDDRPAFIKNPDVDSQPGAVKTGVNSDGQ